MKIKSNKLTPGYLFYVKPITGNGLKRYNVTPPWCNYRNGCNILWYIEATHGSTTGYFNIACLFFEQVKTIFDELLFQTFNKIIILYEIFIIVLDI